MTMAQRPSFIRILLIPALLTLLTLPTPATAQSIGSFFTAIYINGAPASSDQTLCSGMGQSGSEYCCASGQSCAWDDAGKIACCGAGDTCYGTASYTANNGGGWAATTTTAAATPAAVVTTEDCNCEETPASTVYVAPTSTYYYYTPQTLTTSTVYVQPAAPAPVAPAQGPTTVVVQAPQGGAEVGQPSTVAPVACGTVKTVTYANVGAPVKTVGCFVIINGAESGRRVKEREKELGGLVAAFWLLGRWWVLW